MSPFLNNTIRALNRDVSIAPLVTVRLFFGLLMFVGTVRFMYNGWVEQLYIQPKYFFHYYGFDWVQPIQSQGMWLVFIAMAVLSLFISVGFLYRFSSIIFFILFTYVELIDVTNYLNHYYFISLFAFIMIWLPVNKRLSVDVLIWPSIKRNTIPFWMVGALRLQLGVVYFFAGVAKLNSDWLFRAEPLRTWLLSFTHIPVVGKIFTYKLTAFVFSWAGAIYDLAMPLLLSYKRTLPFAYMAVVGFHLVTWLMFPIGMFPWVMIVLTWVFFPSSFHERLVSAMESLLPTRTHQQETRAWKPKTGKPLALFFVAFFLFQLIFPFRYLAYPGNVLWTEQGFRFSWRVMLIEKAGSAQFYVEDAETGRTWDIHNPHYLTPVQEKEMSTQPDLILQYAHILDKEFKSIGVSDPLVRADIFVALNGRRNKRFIDPAVDLSEIEDGWQHKQWILGYEAN